MALVWVNEGVVRDPSGGVAMDADWVRKLELMDDVQDVTGGCFIVAAWWKSLRIPRARLQFPAPRSRVFVGRRLEVTKDSVVYLDTRLW